MLREGDVSGNKILGLLSKHKTIRHPNTVWQLPRDGLVSEAPNANQLSFVYL